MKHINVVDATIMTFLNCLIMLDFMLILMLIIAGCKYDCM